MKTKRRGPVPYRDDVVTLIARAIKKSDRTFVFENYSHQATTVVRMLAENGYAVVPIQPTSAMCDLGRERLKEGVHAPRDVIRSVYAAMITAGSVEE